MLTACAPGQPSTPAGSGVALSSPAAGVVAPPPVGARFDYQLGGAYPPDPAVQIVERDRRAMPVPGRYNICYLNAFQTQPEDAGWWRGNHEDLLLHDAAGRTVGDPDWPGEMLLDTSSTAHRAGVAAVVGPWIRQCAARGFLAVELDNLDSWTRSHERLGASDNVAMARLLVAIAHQVGLAVAQKNAVDIAARARATAGFDFAIAEECQVYSECADYVAVYGRHLMEIEYTDNGRAAFARACALRGTVVSVLLRDRRLLARAAPVTPTSSAHDAPRENGSQLASGRNPTQLRHPDAGQLVAAGIAAGEQQEQRLNRAGDQRAVTGPPVGVGRNQAQVAQPAAGVERRGQWPTHRPDPGGRGSGGIHRHGADQPER